MSDYGMPPGFSSGPGMPVTPVTPIKPGKPSKPGKKPKATTRQSSNLVKWLSIILAALGGLLVVLFLTSSSQQTFVVRANAAIPALVTVGAENLEAVPMPVEAIEPDTFTGATAEEALAEASGYLDGKWLVYPVGAGQQLRTGAFSAIGELAVPLAPEERLISISAKAAKSVAGGVRPGDRIDLYVALTDGQVGLLAENVEVVGVSIAPQEFDAAAQAQLDNRDVTLGDVVPIEPIPGTYVLRIAASDVLRFFAADSQSTIYIALRSPTGIDVPAGRPMTAAEALCTPESVLPACANGLLPGATDGLMPVPGTDSLTEVLPGVTDDGLGTESIPGLQPEASPSPTPSL